MEHRLRGIADRLLTKQKALLILKGGITMYTTGQKPGKGTYKCISCGEIVILDDNTDTLPPCPKCHKVHYIKISG